MLDDFSGRKKNRAFFEKIRSALLGKALNPSSAATRKHSLLIAFLAWVGLGADGLSSACYGPEAAFLALGQNTHLALYLAIAIAATVFIIALGYNQVIELFPSGGGGYKVSTQLIGPFAGLVSGAALIVDYVLTISISIASGVDALFSLLPLNMHHYKHITELLILAILLLLNLRGVKESIKVLMPIFLVFFITHAFLILYGLFFQSQSLFHLVPNTVNKTLQLSEQMGWIFVLSLLLRAYSLGGGTYTGIEAVSNNINQLVAPRVRTGKTTMLYMAFSLAFTAGGIILLYLLWNVSPEPGQTLNATTFKTIMLNWQWNAIDFGPVLLLIVLSSEAALLFVAANTGFLGGPMVLANMAIDLWVPIQFRYISSRLVTQNGLILMGLAALFVLIWTKGSVSLLLVMYSINVFLTFSLSLFGLCIYWLKTKNTEKNRWARFSLSLVGVIVTASILFITIYEKFTEGGWVTLFITSLLVIGCLFIKRHYTAAQKSIEAINEHFKQFQIPSPPPNILPLDPEQPTAIIFVGEALGIGMHTLIQVLSLFPNQFKNFVFLSAGTVDTRSMGDEQDLRDIRGKVNRRLSYFVNYCRAHHLPAAHYQITDVDVIEGLTRLAERMKKRYPNCVFFSGTLIFEKQNWLTNWLHNHTARLLERRLNLESMRMMLLPIYLPNF